jgi:hypothetical protein
MRGKKQVYGPCREHDRDAKTNVRAESRFFLTRDSTRDSITGHDIRIQSEVPLYRHFISLDTRNQIPGSISGVSVMTSAAIHLVARQRKTASAETSASATQMSRKVTKCWRVNVS